MIGKICLAFQYTLCVIAVYGIRDYYWFYHCTVTKRDIVYSNR